jgi:hypothetical protein
VPAKPPNCSSYTKSPVLMWLLPFIFKRRVSFMSTPSCNSYLYSLGVLQWLGRYFEWELHKRLLCILPNFGDVRGSSYIYPFEAKLACLNPYLHSTYKHRCRNIDSIFKPQYFCHTTFVCPAGVQIWLHITRPACYSLGSQFWL